MPKISAGRMAAVVTTTAIADCNRGGPGIRAAQRTKFFDQYRSYVINYNLGRDLVEAYVECVAPEPGDRWQAFTELLGSPRLPSDLVDGAAACR